MRKGKKPISLYVPEDMLEECKKFALLRGLSFSAFIVGLMEKEIKQGGKYKEGLQVMEKLKQEEMYKT